MRPMGVITCAAPMNTSSNVTYTHKKFKRAPIEASEALDHQHPPPLQREAPAGPIKASTLCIETPLTPTNGLLVAPPASIPAAATSPAAPEAEEARRRNGRGGKYKCEYCGMGCAKPSVLDKHKRTHTNERPYSCSQCSTAFKTKSNLLKHTRSRSHALRLDGPDGSDGAVESGDNGDGEEGVRYPGSQQCLPLDVSLARHPDPPSSSMAARGAPEASRDHGSSIYKPKFRVRPYLTGEEEASPPRTEHQATPPRDPPDGHAAITSTYHAPTSTLSHPGAHPGHPAPPRHCRPPQEIRSAPRKEDVGITGPSSSSPSLKSVSMWKGIEPPSPEMLEQHITKLIVENEAIIETHTLWPRRYKRQPSLGSSSSESESSGSGNSRRGSLADPVTKSSKGSVPAPTLQGQLRERSHSLTTEAMLAESRSSYSPRLPPATLHLPLAQPTASASKPSISLPGLTTSYSQSPPPHLESGLYEVSRKRCLSEGPGIPRDLTKGRPSRPLEDQVDLQRQHHPRNPEGSVIKNLLLGPQGSVDQRGRFVPHSEAGPFPCSRCRMPCRTLEDLDIHMHHFCGQRSGLGSDRGTPELVKNGEGGRWVGEQDVALDLHVKPDSVDPERSSSRSSCGVEDLSQESHIQQQSPKVHRSRSAPDGTAPHVKKRKQSAPDERSLAFNTKNLEAGKLKNHQLFGGEVQICDGHERKTMRIDPGQQASPALEICIPPQQLGGGALAKAESSVPTSVVVTIAKSSLHSGGTMVQVESQLSTTTKTTPSLVTSATHHKEQPTPTIAKVVHPTTPYPAEGSHFSSFPYFTEFAPHLQLPNLAIPGIPTPDLGSLSFTSYCPRVPNPALLQPQTTSAHAAPNNHKQNVPRSPADPPKASFTPPFPGAQGQASSGVIHGSVGRAPVPEAESSPSQPRDKEKDPLVGKGLPKHGLPTLIPFGDTKVPHVPGIPGPYSQPSPVCPLPNGGQRRQPAVFTLPSQTCVTFSGPITSVPVSSMRETSLVVPRPREPPRSPGRERGPAGGSTLRLSHHLPHKDLLSPRPRPSLGSPRLPELKPINQETKLLPAPLEPKILERAAASPEPRHSDTPSKSDAADQEFLPPRKRPNFLALKPQPFVPKSSLALMGTTLVSPDTPRPKKSCVQMFLNGSAYTYLGHKVSTKTYYCCIYRQQPMYAPQGPNSKLSMYSNWQTKPEDPFKLVPCPAMSLYQSCKRDRTFTVAQPKELDLIQTHSSYWTFKQKKEKHKEEEAKQGDKDTPEIKSEEPTSASSAKATEASSGEAPSVVIKREAEDTSGDCPSRSSDDSEGTESIGSNKRIKIFEGGFKSTEDYTYVRGRGRGRYVCGTCGIRCKKPSMLRKHCRTHTDLRPYACSHCSFSFKTKGNLTKHLRSKAHYKRCVEMGVVPVPTVVDESHVNEAALAWQDKLEQERKPDSLDGEDDDDDEDEDEEEDVDDEDEDEEEEVAMEGQQFQDAHEHHSQRAITPGTSVGTAGTSHSAPGPAATRPGGDVAGLPSSRSGVLVMQHTPTPSLPPFSSSTSLSNSSSSMPSSTSPTSTTTITPTVAVTSSSSSLSSPSSSASPSSSSPSSRVDSSRDCPMDLSVRRGAGGGSADKAAPHRPSFLPVLSRSALLESPGLPSPSTPIREHPSEILSPVTESSSLLKSIYQTTERAAQASAVVLDPTTENGSSRSMLNAYLRERAVLDTAIKRQQYSFSDASPGSPHLPPGESQGQEQAAVVAAAAAAAAGQEGKNGERISPPAPLSNTSNTTSTFTTSTTISNSAIIVTSSQVSSSSASSSASRMPTPPANLTVMNSGGLDTKTAFLVPSGVVPSSLNRLTNDDGKCKCTFCHKEFNRPAQLSLHMNIHYMERPFRCDSCAVSFRTNGHLQKHKRSVSHFNKVNMNMTFGTPSTDNPRPFKCHDCKIAFRIHGHLAKHLRSKMHIMKLECLGKLPFGTYAEIERSGANLNEIDTTDCDNSLESLQAMASRLYEKDPTKLAAWRTQQGREHHRVRTISNSSTNSDDYPLQDDQDDPVAGIGHDEDTEGDDDEEVAGPRDVGGRGSLSGVAVTAGDIHGQSQSPMEMGLSPTASLLVCHLCHEKFLEPEHLSSHLYSVHKVSASYRNS